jgi:hypothetical protein
LVAETTNDIDLTEEKALFMTSCKDKCQNCGRMDHKATNFKDRHEQQPRADTQVICNLNKIMGYCGETHLKATTNVYKIKVFGKLEARESCSIIKAKQKKIN